MARNFFEDIAEAIAAGRVKPTTDPAAIAGEIVHQIVDALPHGRVEEFCRRMETDPQGLARCSAFRKLGLQYLAGKGPAVVSEAFVVAILGPKRRAARAAK